MHEAGGLSRALVVDLRTTFESILDLIFSPDFRPSGIPLVFTSFVIFGNASNNLGISLCTRDGDNADALWRIQLVNATFRILVL